MDDLVFNPELACRGLIIDKKLGNLVKVDRFGQVKRAMHGTRRLSIRETHDVYGRSTVELRDSGVCVCVCIHIHLYMYICIYVSVSVSASASVSVYVSVWAADSTALR